MSKSRLPSSSWAQLACVLAAVACGVDDREVRSVASPNTPTGNAGATAGVPGLGGGADAGIADVKPILPVVAASKVLSSSLSRLDFEPREVGTVSADLDWVIENVSERASGTLSSSNSNPSDFQLTQACPAVLGAGASCTIGVQFRPQSAGPHVAIVQLRDGADAVSLEVIGTGQHRLSVVRIGSSGTVSSASPGIDCGSTCNGLFSGVVTLNARTENGQDSFFTAWSDAACAGTRHACVLTMDQPRTVTANFAPMIHNLLFVSSRPYPADLGGLAAYDAECNRLATAEGINDASSTGFVATLTDSVDSASAAGPFVGRVGSARGWVRMDGLPVADEASSLIATPYYPASLTERGERFNDLVWTGYGTRDASDTRCGDWTNALATESAGMGFAHHLHWLSTFASLCNQRYPIYCMGRTKQLPLGPVTSFQGKRFWISLGPYIPGSMTPDQQCQAHRPAGVAQAVAFVAYTDRPASAVIDRDATYVMPDGRLIGTGRQILAADLITGPWLLEDGTTFSGFGVWTGAVRSDPFGPGTPESTCLNWTSTDSSLTAGTGASGYSDRAFWDGGLGASCSGTTGFAGPLYCVEP